jgi:PTH1 family peptidyl-tRNA hydrolase
VKHAGVPWLHDFAKVEYTWLDPLLDAMVDAAPYLAQGDSSRFLSQVARVTRDDEAPEEKTPEPPVRKAEPRPKAAHPAGERVAKRAGALAENLKKWLAGRGDKALPMERSGAFRGLRRALACPELAP